MTGRLPPALDRHRDEDDELADVEAARGTTQEQRARILEALCRMAAEQIAQHPDPQRSLDWQDEVSDEALALLARLRRARA